MSARRKLTAVDKLKVLVRQSVCPRCGEKLGRLDQTEFDHITPMALGGADGVENLVGLHASCHQQKTSGRAPGAARTATTAGSDVHVIAKVKRLAMRDEDFRRRLLAKAPGENVRPKSKWPSRPMRKAEER